MTTASYLAPNDHERTITDRFISAFRHHPAGVALITADSGAGPVALTATSVSSLSADPPMVMFSASGKSSSTPTITKASTVVVHLLDESDLPLAKLGATSGIDRFADTSLWSRLPTGEARFHGAATWLRARVVKVLAVNDSYVVIAEVLDAGGRNTVDNAEGTGAPLIYHERAWHALNRTTVIS